VKIKYELYLLFSSCNTNIIMRTEEHMYLFNRVSDPDPYPYPDPH
jgi:hypothetical protein